MTGRDLPQAIWRKSSYSEPNGGNCVEVAVLADAVALRDSKNPGGPALVLTPSAWESFIAGVRAGDFPRTLTLHPTLRSNT